MNARGGKWVSSMLALGVGVALCVMWRRQDILQLIVYLIGGLFALTGFINFLVSTHRRRNNTAGTGATFAGTTSGIGGMCIGAAMLLIPSFFVGIIVYALAVILIIAGLWHIYILGYGFAPLKFPGWFYIFPVLVIVEGVVILCAGSVRASADIVVLMTGIGITVYAATSILELVTAGFKGRGAVAADQSLIEEGEPM